MATTYARVQALARGKGKCHNQAMHQILVIGGPTASGKTALAIDLARALDGIVINADSMQLYANLPILSGTPDAAERGQTPHHLFGALSAPDRASAGIWARLAKPLIEAAWSSGHVPIVVGGTGLYLKTLMEGLSPIPDIPEDVHAATETLCKAMGPEGLHQKLALVDPDAAARIGPTDPQRLKRAWEVYAATGTSLTTFQAQPPSPLLTGASFVTLAIVPETSATDDALTARFHGMLDAGAETEVAALVRSGMPDDHPIWTCLGARQIRALQAGDLSREEAVSQAVTATRQYAKRQRTWFRNQFDAQIILSEKYSERLFQKIFSEIRDLGLTGPP